MTTANFVLKMPARLSPELLDVLSAHPASGTPFNVRAMTWQGILEPVRDRERERERLSAVSLFHSLSQPPHSRTLC